MTTSEWDRAVKAAAQDTTITDLIKADRWDEARRIVTERDRRVEQMTTWLEIILVAWVLPIGLGLLLGELIFRLEQRR